MGFTSKKIYETPSQDVFNYFPGGVIISYMGSSFNVKWDKIYQINVFKIDLITVDRIEMEITSSNEVILINEDYPGFYPFVKKLTEVFPTISSTWLADIVNPAFEKNAQMIYNASSAHVLSGIILDEKLQSLIKVGGDENWNTYYLDKDGAKWVKSFPDSGYHGGGAPLLTKVEHFPNEEEGTL